MLDAGTSIHPSAADMMSAAFVLLEQIGAADDNRQIGDVSGTNRNTVASYRNGQMPSMNFISNLCRSADTPIEHFFVIARQFAEGVPAHQIVVPKDCLSPLALKVAQNYDMLDAGVRYLLHKATSAQIAMLCETIALAERQKQTIVKA